MNRTLEDELLIRRTMERYMRYNDDRALDRIVSLFTADAVYRVVGEEHVGHDAIRAFLGARGFEDDRPEWTEPDQLMVMPRSTHVMSNPVIDVHGDDATAESDFVVIVRDNEGHAHIRLIGRYRDRLRRSTTGEWLIAERTGVSLARQDAPDGSQEPPPRG